MADTPSGKMDTHEVLVKAAEDMSTYGKAEGSFYARSENWQTAAACAYGSMGRVVGMTRADGTLDTMEGANPTLDAAAEKLASTIARLHPDHEVVKLYTSSYTSYSEDWNNNIRTWDIVTNFNDRVDKETMVLALKEAAHG